MAKLTAGLLTGLFFYSVSGLHPLLALAFAFVAGYLVDATADILRDDESAYEV